jgi:hypothetical protein
MSATKEPQENTKDADSDPQDDKKGNEREDEEPTKGKPIKRKHTFSPTQKRIDQPSKPFTRA